MDAGTLPVKRPGLISHRPGDFTLWVRKQEGYLRAIPVAGSQM